ncbi:RecF/RecN/SMC N terminal domain-containing protein [Lentinula detonsa]|uniref:Structural maintenance of chromosomes protein 4 n=1 Tax=Lentinula detonsa TaxID=2804962 RepID=A0A9W8P4V5_9AGAR|nr:RecF/RecN/SMC N terminal domain-containing protein [Lentinula detonsa]
MPPRRSTRSRASVEPVPVEPPSIKRKRSQLPVTDLEEKENQQKLASSSRRSSSARLSNAASTRSRPSTRRRPAEPTVKEEQASDTDSEEDGDQVHPPKKKKRPSIDRDEEEEDRAEDDEMPELKPRQTVKRGRPPRASAQPRSNRSQKPVAISSDEDEEASMRPEYKEEEYSAIEERKSNSRLPTRSRQTVKKEPPSRSTQSRTVRTTKLVPISDDEETDVKPQNEQESDVEEYEMPKRKPRVSMSPMKPSSSRSYPPSNKHDMGDDKEEEQIADDDDDDVMEERSLLIDHPPSLPPASQPQAQPVLEEPKGPQSRLVIYKLALVNFKSYAGRQEIGPFHKSFSSIVGANGSGKSNTIDALLFVFGYRASKMRQGKLSELIHNSARYPDLKQCSVEVHFREIIDLPGPDAFDIVPGSNLVVGRHAYKDNTSTYTVNGRNSTYKEVQSLLKGRGIDLDHKRFLILQGEVESIAQMKSKGGEHDEGLLEYLEDIIGTSKYKEPIEAAFVELENLQESRQEKLNRLRLVEKEKNALEDKKKEAEEYLRLQNELVRAQSKLYQWYIWQTLNSENKIREQMEEAANELEEEKAKNKDDIEHLQALQADYKAFEKGYKDIQKLVAEAVQSLSEHEKQEIGLSEKRKHAAGKAKKLKKSVGDARSALKSAQHTIEDSEEKLEKEKKNLEKYEESLVTEEKVLEEIQDSLRDKTQKFYDQKEALQKDLQPWTTKINTKQTEIDVARGERDALVRKVESIQTALQEAEEHLERVRSDQEEKVKLLAEAKSEKAELNNKKEASIQRLSKAQESEQAWRTKASSSHQRVLEAKSSQAETRSQGKVLESLTRMQDNGRITGFHGRLGSLGTIPEKYDVAITTACPSLNHMVVDTVKQGQACLEYLRSNNIGRATFMVLEKISYNPSVLSPPKTPENVPRLFDLITPKDSKFAEVFYKAVGDTLVAKDMDQANRIAFGEKRTKVVTLAGQVIETSGAMSGGGGAPAKGGMSPKQAKDSVSPRQLQELEQEREQTQAKLEEATAAVRSAEAELELLNRSGPEIDLRYEKLGLDIQQGKSRIEEAEKRLKNMKTRSTPDKNDVTRIKVLEDNLARFEIDIGDLKGKASTIEAALQEVEDKIMKIGGSKLMAQKSKVEGLRNHINLTNDAITNAEVTKAKAEKDVEKHQDTVENDVAALEQLETELAELDCQLGELQGFVKTVKAKVEAAEAAEESKREALVERKAQLEEKTEAVEAFRQTEIKLQKAIDGHQKDIDRISSQVERFRELHDALILEDVDDEEEEGEGEDEGEDEEALKHQDESIARRNKTEGVTIKAETPQEEEVLNKLHEYKTSELQKFKERDMKVDVQALEDQIKRAKPNLNVLEEYKRREAEFLSRHDDLEKVVALRDTQKKKYEDLRKQRLEEFMAGFSIISLKLKEMYQMITQGGNAELELVDSMDPFAEGIIFSVMPPKKSWKNISNLSGGEKTLSSLALVFALHVFKPTPLYFMDEIDAALDFRNVSIIANYIKDRTKNAQFIIISLRNDMFELSHRLIGIYKTANATQSISIDNHALTARPANSASINASTNSRPSKDSPLKSR